MQPRYHSKMQCRILKIFYDFDRRRGQVVMADGDCTDMSGCIDVLAALDPEVELIETGFTVETYWTPFIASVMGNGKQSNEPLKTHH